MNRRCWVSGCLLWAVGFSAYAEKLSWDECVREASAQNADLLASQSALRAAEANASGAYSTFFPQVSAGVNYNYGSSATSGTADAGAQSSYTAALTANQNLFSGFSDAAKVHQAQANLESARMNLAIAKAKLSYDLKSAFANLAYVQKQVKLAADVVRRRAENLKLVELRFQVGRENKGSVLLSRAALSEAKLAALQADHALYSARDQLAKALGRDDSDALEVGGGLPLQDPGSVAPDFRALAREVPDRRLAEITIQSAQAALEASRSGFFPTLTVTGSKGIAGGDGRARENSWSVGAGLNVPLFSGLRDYYATKSSAESVASARVNADGSLRQALLALRQSWSDYSESAVALSLNREYLDAAQTRAEIARVQYNNGLATFVDWDLIENDLIKRQNTALQSERDRVVSEAAWEQTQGKGAIQ
ncbi:MAG: TolC family protein [Bdellovibrionales bacterium]|nr:TolC family protein [Bdellovibrionales bacterium]